MKGLRGRSSGGENVDGGCLGGEKGAQEGALRGYGGYGECMSV